MKQDKIFFRYKHDTSALKLDVYNLMTKSYIELGQKPDEVQIRLNAKLLYEDLTRYHGGMTISEVEFAFHTGIRDADEGTSCFLNVRQWSVWLKKHKGNAVKQNQIMNRIGWGATEKNQIGTTINRAKIKLNDKTK